MLRLIAVVVFALSFAGVCRGQDASPHQEASTAGEVLERFNGLIGANTGAPVTSVKIEGLVRLPKQGLRGTFVWDVQAAGPFEIRLEIEGIGETVQTWDGASGTVRTPDGKSQAMTPSDAESARQTVVTFFLGYDPESFTSIEKLEPERVGGKDCAVLALTRPSGSGETAYFELGSGYLVRSVLEVTLDSGEREHVTIDYSDYRQVDGFRYAKLMRVTFAGTPSLYTVREAEIRRDPAGTDDGSP